MPGDEEQGRGISILQMLGQCQAELGWPEGPQGSSEVLDEPFRGTFILNADWMSASNLLLSVKQGFVP